MARSGGAGSPARATVGAIRKSPATMERYRPVVIAILDRPTRSVREARDVHPPPRAKHCLVLTERLPDFLAEYGGAGFSRTRRSVRLQPDLQLSRIVSLHTALDIVS